MQAKNSVGRIIIETDNGTRIIFQRG